MKEKSVGSLDARRGNALFGGILILLGLVFLAGMYFDIQIGRFVWPFFIIVPGAALFLASLALDHKVGEGVAAAGSIITMVGLLLFYQSVSGHWESWSYAWALVAPTSVGLGLMAYGRLKGRPETAENGRQVAKVGLMIFLVAALFFELLIGVSGFGLGQYIWPLVLIGLGAWLLVRNFMKSASHS